MLIENQALSSVPNNSAGKLHRFSIVEFMLSFMKTNYPYLVLRILWNVLLLDISIVWMCVWCYPGRILHKTAMPQFLPGKRFDEFYYGQHWSLNVPLTTSITAISHQLSHQLHWAFPHDVLILVLFVAAPIICFENWHHLKIKLLSLGSCVTFSFCFTCTI